MDKQKVISSIYGPGMVKALHGPVPQAKLMPTGGVSLENVDRWFENGVVAVTERE